MAPYGGDGSRRRCPMAARPGPLSLPPAGFSNYNAPGGLTDIGNGQNIKNYSIRSFVGGMIMPTAVYDTAIDPNIHVNVLDWRHHQRHGIRQRDLEPARRHLRLHRRFRRQHRGSQRRPGILRSEDGFQIQAFSFAMSEPVGSTPN